MSINIVDQSEKIKFKKWLRVIPVTTAVIHHTVSPKVGGTEKYLQTTSYGYHYMVEKDGTIFYYMDPAKWGCNHAQSNNSYTVGISCIGGGDFGPLTKAQIRAVADIINLLRNTSLPKLKFVTGHKDLSPDRKIDPRFEGEPPNGVDWDIHTRNMQAIATNSLTQYLPRKHLR